jgi:hypothetical protein
MILNHWFPTTIAISECPFIDEIQKPYKNIISKYKYDSSGFCRERVHLNKKFKKLNTWVNQEIKKYAAHKDENTEHKVIFNELTYAMCSYPPKTGLLIIWRSYLSHGCYNKQLDCKRIVFTYNFDKV